MAEEAEAAAEAGGETPTATALALAGASRAEADAYLRDQRHHLHEQLRQLGPRLWELRLGVLLRIATAFIGIAVAAALAWLVWNAAASNDLVIDAFAVPPDLAARGLSGPVVAAKLSDRIAAMQTQTISARAPKSYTGLSDGLKLEIPETGVSLSELDRFLRQKLGHDQHIGGEMVQTEKGIALTARAGADSATVNGTEAGMDDLLQKLAEQVYRTTQPYRFGVWLQLQGRNPEAVAVFKTLAATGPASERAWAYNGWAVNTLQRESERAGLALLRRGFVLDPHHFLIAGNIAGSERRLGREEESLRDVHVGLELLKTYGRDYTTPDRIAAGEHNYEAVLLRHRGALLEALTENRLSLEASGGANAFGSLSLRTEILVGLHETGAARDALAERPQITTGANQLPIGVPSLGTALEEQDWAGTLAAEKEFDLVAATLPGLAEDRPTMAGPFIAVALAHLGRFAQAEARLKPMPGDCYPCLIARAQVAALERQPERADFWFARAVAAAPTAPYADTEWGKTLLARGHADDAIAHFAAASKIGPHFADPLEFWGEALMAKNQSHLALAKFAEAEKYAPNWGRLHLKWGEALLYAGRPAEAKAQFARAAVLDLTPDEKTELQKFSAHPI